MYFVRVGSRMVRKRMKKMPVWMRVRCLFVVGKSFCRRGQASSLFRPICYQGSPGPPGVPSRWPKSEGLSLWEGEESEPLFKDG